MKTKDKYKEVYTVAVPRSKEENLEFIMYLNQANESIQKAINAITYPENPEINYMLIQSLMNCKSTINNLLIIANSTHGDISKPEYVDAEKCFYYKLGYFKSRAQQKEIYVKSLVESNGKNDETLLLDLVKNHEIQVLDANHITSIERISMEEYLEIGGKRING